MTSKWGIFWPKRDEVREEWRIPLDEEFYDLYFAQNIIRVIELGRMRWEGL